MSKWVVDAEHFAGYAKAWLNPSGVCPYTGKTPELYAKYTKQTTARRFCLA